MAATQDISQLQAIMRFHAAYRLVLAASLCGVFFVGPDQSILGSTHHALFALLAPIYLGLAVVALVRHRLPVSRYGDSELFFEFLVDIGLLAAMTYASGGADSGLQLLLFVTISASSITLPGRLSLSLASLASIAALVDVALHTLNQRVPTQQFVVAGMLGIAYFSTAIAIRYLSIRIVNTQSLAERRRSDIVRLSRINQMIVQRMQTGIMVMSPAGTIRLINAAAAELLGLPDTELAEDRCAPAALVEMTRSGGNGSRLITLGEGRLEVHVTMTGLNSGASGDRLVYLENLSKLSQRAQQMKLASLGRFTASIAHEIRNPLGAISHAAQLLAESPHLDGGDQRFVSIIHSNASRMNGIIKNILELSRGRQSLPERIDLEDWLRDFIADWRPTDATAVDIRLDSHHGHSEVTVDAGQLHQIISNITDNGARHGAAAQGKAILHFRLSSSPIGQAAILDIIDNGAGIAPDEEDRIFEPFYTTQSQGNGLGLYLCRELCLANQINIHYRRTAENESCFRLQFSHPDRAALPE